MEEGVEEDWWRRGWRRTGGEGGGGGLVEEGVEEDWWRRTGGGDWWRRTGGGGLVEEDWWRRTGGGGLVEEDWWRRTGGGGLCVCMCVYVHAQELYSAICTTYTHKHCATAFSMQSCTESAYQYFGIFLHKLCADVTRPDSPWGSKMPHLMVGASKSF